MAPWGRQTAREYLLPGRNIRTCEAAGDALPRLVQLLLQRWRPEYAARTTANDWPQDEAVYDAYVGSWEYRPDPRLLIVAIDDNSLQQIGQWPWPRATHAQLLDRLTQAGSTRVVLDLMLSEPDRQDAAQDADLAAAIRRNGHVVLPVLAAPASGPRMAEELLPIPLIAANAATLGHTDIEVDADGVARGLYSLCMAFSKSLTSDSARSRAQP